MDNAWSIEIETATVSTLWHQPHRLPEFRRIIDPQIHITQPHLRHILEAIELCYGELGIDLDFATVVEVVRELGTFNECGGIEGLNQVYTGAETTLTTDHVFGHYVGMLQEYARARESHPPRRVTRFSGGKATLYLNKNKRSTRDPDYLGEARARGHNYSLRGWLAPDLESVNVTMDPV